MIVEVIVDNASAVPKLATAGSLLDHCATLYGSSPSGKVGPGWCNVVFRTGKKSTEGVQVPLGMFRRELAANRVSRVFDLRVEAVDLTWEIPVDNVPQTAEVLNLDNAWVNHIVSRMC